LNATSVVLEGSSASCGGARINVDLSHLKSTKTAYSLFPGQIVALEGMNPTGRKLVAHRICEGAAHPSNTSSIKELREFHCDRQDGAPLKMITACGPFTTSDTMDYQPLVDLMHVVMEQAPDVVVLAGPFVDVRQDLVKQGKTTVEVDDGVEKIVSFEALFANKIAGLIEEAFEGDELATQFVLVPSLDDATARWV
jgi:DNA polymerase alpha subunit B